MKEAVLPIPVSNIKKEPCDEAGDLPGSKPVTVAPDGERGGRSFPDLSGGESLTEDGRLPGSSSALDRLTSDRSDQLSNGSDSDVVIRDDGEVGNKCDFKYECPICQARFKSARAFRGHGIVHRFGSSADVRSGHLGSMDGGQSSLQYSPKRLGFESSSFKCDGCQTVFNSRDTYAMHMMMRAKDENCKGIVTDCKHQLLMDDAGDRSGTADAQVETQNALRQNFWNLQMLQKSRTEGKMLDYQPVIPDLIPSPGGSRELIVCRICGELFQNKDSLAMHMMFHTRSEAENSRRGWTVIYSSAMSDLGENPEDLIANHELVPIDDPSHESLDSVPHVANDAELAYGEGVSDDPCYSDEANEGLDLSMASKVNGMKNDNSTDHAERLISKAPNWLGVQDSKITDLPAASFITHDPDDFKRVPNDVQQRLFCVQYDLSKTPSHISRSHSADVTMPRKADTDDQRDINIIKCLTENPDRVAHAQNGVTEQVRAKSADVVMHRHDRHTASSAILGKIRKLRKSRVPTRKNPFRPPYRLIRQSEGGKSPMPQNQPEPTKSACPEGDKNIVDLLATRGKDLSYCKYCEIIYLDRTLYQLHMGLHNVNNPWQCNACGRVCANRLQFSSHVLHY